MWKSRAITITLLSGLMLTACCISMTGCGGGRRAAPDHTWYDASGNRIEERWKTDASGNKVLDDQGRPIPEPGVPYDRYHRPWVYTGGVWAPPPPPAGYSSTSRTGSNTGMWLWGGSGYRSTTSSPAYRSGTGTGSVSPSRSSSSPSSSSSSSSSITRGGFGSTGMSSSSSSS